MYAAIREKLKSYRLQEELHLYPRSLLQLLLMGFAVTVVPLMIALGTAAVYVDRVTSQTQSAVVHATQTARHSQMLAEHLRNMERSARVYQVLGDDELLQAYQRDSKSLRQSAQMLLQTGFQAQDDDPVRALLDYETMLLAVFTEADSGSREATAALDTFETMQRIVRALILDSTQVVHEKVQSMHDASIEARRILLWAAILILLAALTLGFLVIPPLLRAMRHLDRSIQQLGSGNFEERIGISGPKDIRALGVRLEWLRQQLELQENQKRIFLRHFSHELKTPLASIREGAGLLADNVVGNLNNEQAEIARILQDNSLKLQKRIEDLLTFSVSQHPDIIDPRPCRLDLQIEDVLRDHHLPVKAKKLQFFTKLEPLVIDGDPPSLSNVLDNLVSNAVKYSPEKGAIYLTLSEHDGHAVFDIRDEGPGIAPEERELVFHAFYQGSNDYQSHVKGTGLGLSIAAHYAHAHGGDIVVLESTIGAHLRLTLPIKKRCTA